MTQKTEMMHVRLSSSEKSTFISLSKSAGETPSRLIRKMIREAINGELDLLHDDQQLLLVAIRQLAGMANNLNQITMAIHAGRYQSSLDHQYLNEVKKQVIQVKAELEVQIKKTRTRWVRSECDTKTR